MSEHQELLWQMRDNEAIVLFGARRLARQEKKGSPFVATKIGPPTRIIAMDALDRRKAEFDRKIAFFWHLRKCLAGFSAVAADVEAIHTGRWGCGVFENDLLDMVLVQCIAAILVGIKRVVFHAVDEIILLKVQSILEKSAGKDRPVEAAFEYANQQKKPLKTAARKQDKAAQRR